MVSLDDDIKDAIGTNVEQASMFMKVKVNSEMYYSQRYDRLRSRNSYTVCYKDDTEKYGPIRHFLSIPGWVMAVVPLFIFAPPHYPLNKRMIPVALSSSLCSAYQGIL